MGYSFVIETAEPTAVDLILFIKQHNIKIRLIESSETSQSGFDVIQYSSPDANILSHMLKIFWQEINTGYYMS